MAPPPIARDNIIAAITTNGPMSAQELTEYLGAKRHTVNIALQRARELKLLYIKKYRRTTGRGGREVPLYALGDQPDAKRPNLGSREAVRKRKLEWARKNGARLNLKAQARRRGAANINPYLQLRAYAKTI